MNVKILVFFLLLVLVSCTAVAEKQSAPVVKNNPELNDRAAGPVFLPADSLFRSVEMIYYTPVPMETVVYFSMAGDVDWVRSQPEETKYHSMVFNGLEENAEYHFRFKEMRKGNGPLPGIITLPYGQNYSVDFAVTAIDEKPALETRPRFLVVLAPRGAVTESRFRQYINENAELLSRTIMVPFFTIEGRHGSDYRKKAHILQYRDIRLVYIPEVNPGSRSALEHKDTAPGAVNYVFTSADSAQEALDFTKAHERYFDDVFASAPGGLYRAGSVKAGKVCGVRVVKENRVVYHQRGY